MTGVTPQFRAAIQAAGLTAPDTIEADGKLHRFASNGRRGDLAGWYVLHGDGIPAGAFGDWRSGLKEDWHADPGRVLTDAEREQYWQRVAAVKLERERAEHERHAEAAERAAREWDAAEPATAEHPYLASKGVQAHGLRVDADGRLLVPVRNGTGELQSLQRITADGEKRFLGGGQMTGGYFAIGGRPTDTLCIAEGYATGASIHEATGFPVAVAFNAGNLPAVAQALREKLADCRLIVCADDDARTEGNPGLTKAREAALAVGALLAVPDFGPDRAPSMTDFNDLSASHGPEAVRRAIANASAPAKAEQDSPTDDVVIARLVTLNPLEYDRCREAEANRLGVRVGTLDAMVCKARGETETGDGQGRAIRFEVVEPWPDPVDGAALLDDIAATASRHLVLPDHGSEMLALWAALTWIADKARVLPLLAITSPEKRCGKTTVLDWLTRLCHRPRATANITASALFRFVEKYAPTLLIDEADTFLAASDELRGILNSGHTRTSAYVIRTTGEDFEPREFSTWCPKAIAAIGKLPDTVADRSIQLRMKRKGPGESAEPLPADDSAYPIRQRLARWAADYGDAITSARPPMPAGVFNRKADNWRTLLAIADTAGGRWPSLARAACVASLKADGEDNSLRATLLEDMRAIFAAHGTDRLPTEDAIRKLTEMNERPWSECNKGKAISARQLSRWLGEFDIRSRDIRPEGQKNCKGYRLDDFTDAFARYLPPDGENPAFHPRHRDNGSTTRVSAASDPRHDAVTVTDDPRQSRIAVTDETARKPSNSAGCHVVTDKNTKGDPWAVEVDV